VRAPHALATAIMASKQQREARGIEVGLEQTLRPADRRVLWGGAPQAVVPRIEMPPANVTLRVSA
jgi:hypothetical protein